LKSFFQKTATIFVTLIVCLAIGEVALRHFTLFPVTTKLHKAVHPKLGYTFAPALDDIDEHGFRNPPGEWDFRDIAVIGDSMAYGYNVTRESSFPSQMAKATGRHVYNFGIGSYGIYQYKVLLDEVRRLDFNTVVLALLPANDAAPTCSSTEIDYWRDYARENNIEIAACYGSPYPTGLRRYARVVSDAIKRSATVDAVRILALNNIRDLLATKAAIGTENYFLFPKGVAMHRGNARTLLQSAAFENPGVRLTFENSKLFLAEGNRALKAKGTGFVVMLVPDKALILQAWAEAEGFETEPEFVELAGYPKQVAVAYKEFFEHEGIAYIDALPHVLEAFRSSLAEGREFYPASDGHPYAEGYEAIAEAAIEGLRLIER
jgi:lysophospholipase L1-like esterase